MDVGVKPIGSWTDFETEIESLETRQQPRPSSLRSRSLLYRGLGSAEWKLETTLERSAPHERVSTSLDYERYYFEVHGAQHALEAFGKRTFDPLPTPPEFGRLLRKSNTWSRGIPRGKQGEAVYRYLIYLRHHGFPSPLLDWTRSPYLAAFFAFDAMPPGAAEVAIYVALRDSMRAFSADRSNMWFIGPFVGAHPRHFRQQCDYSVCLRRTPDGSAEFAPHEDAIEKGVGIDGRLYKLAIPANLRTLFLKKLDSMNITPYTVYDSEDALVRTMARQQLLFRS